MNPRPSILKNTVGGVVVPPPEPTVEVPVSVLRALINVEAKAHDLLDNISRMDLQPVGTTAMRVALEARALNSESFRFAAERRLARGGKPAVKRTPG